MTERPHPDLVARPPGRRVGRPAGPTSKGAASRDAIIDAASSVFARLGYEGARMADIVAASGLSKGSVYFHFDGKEALAVAVLEARHDRWIADVLRVLERTPSGASRLRGLLPAMLALHRDDPDAWVTSRLTQNLAEVASTRHLAAAVTRRWIDLVATVIREAVPVGGTASTDDVETVATVLVGSFDGLKMTVDVLTAGDRVAAERMLTEGGRVLERMLFEALGLDAA